MEIENRIRNLFWTISGDYTLDVKPDVEAFARSREIALYDALKQGAFARYFDAEELGLGSLDASVAEYFNALMLHPISKQFISALADVRMHPMSHRRYMWKFSY